MVLAYLAAVTPGHASCRARMGALHSVTPHCALNCISAGSVRRTFVPIVRCKLPVVDAGLLFPCERRSWKHANIVTFSPPAQPPLQLTSRVDLSLSEQLPLCQISTTNLSTICPESEVPPRRRTLRRMPVYFCDSSVSFVNVFLEIYSSRTVLRTHDRQDFNSIVPFLHPLVRFSTTASDTPCQPLETFRRRHSKPLTSPVTHHASFSPASTTHQGAQTPRHPSAVSTPPSLPYEHHTPTCAPV